MLRLARPPLRPAKHDGESEKGCDDDAYEENDMSGHGTLFFQLISIARSSAKRASALIQINLRACERDGMMSR